MCRDTLRSGTPFSVYCWDLVLQRNKQKETRQDGLFTFFMAPEATCTTVTAKWSILISTQRIKTKDYTVKSETIGSNPYCCQWAKFPFTSHVANSYVIAKVGVPLNCFSQTVLRSRAVLGVYKAKFWFFSLQQISLKTQRLPRKPICHSWKMLCSLRQLSVSRGQLVLSEHFKLAILKTL